MKRRMVPWVALFWLGLCALLPALPQVAVLEAIVPQDMDPAVVIPITDKISEALVNSGRYTVLDREHVAQILAEKELQLSGLVKAEEIRKVGEYLGADFVAVARAARVGETFFLSARMIDVKTGAITVQTSGERQGRIEVLLALAGDAGRKLAGGVVDAAAGTTQPPSPASPPEDIAVNRRRTGDPSPLESDAGWGGGSDPWGIVDGVRSSSNWAHGLAFTGGPEKWAGEACGWRQATIDFGRSRTFDRIVVWHHGLEHVPDRYKIQYWNGAKWTDIVSTTEGKSFLKYPSENPSSWWEGTSTPTENAFPAVTASKVRFAFYNCDITHGWIYEVEVYNDRRQ